MSSRLPETDLANWSFLSPADKRRALTAFEGPKIIKGSYEPFRKVFPDAVNQQFPLFEDGLETSGWEAVEQRLRQECKGDQVLIDMNRAILAATHLYSNEYGIAATGIDVVPLRFPGFLAYSFGLNLLIRYRDRSCVVFLDMRRTHGLSPNGRPFMFSAMHHRFRLAYPDLAEAELEIWRFKNNKLRTLVSQRAGEVFYSYEQLVADVVETHEIWHSVRRGDGEARRAAGGSPGPLFD
jgi:hypothetical protein